MRAHTSHQAGTERPAQRQGVTTIADASASALRLQRYQPLADNSPQTRQLQQRSQMMAAQRRPVLQSVTPAAGGIMQMQWAAIDATNFVTANPPIRGELPAAWKVRVNAQFAATQYDNNNATDKNRLGTAFHTYYRANCFTQADATNFVAAHVPVRPMTYAGYMAAQAGALTGAGYQQALCEDLMTNAFATYRTNHPFAQGDADAYFALNPPPIGPQTHDVYVAAHIEALGAWGIWENGGTYASVLDLFDHSMDAFRTTQQDNHALLDDYYDALGDDVKTHVFDGEFNNNAPKGLHAHGGAAGNTHLQTIGNPNTEHILIWTNASGIGVNKCKWSSMFPVSYPKGMSAWHLLHHADRDTYPVAARPTVGLPAWQAIAIGQAGATRYPEVNGVNSTAAVQGLAGGTIVNGMHAGHVIYRWQQGGRNYVIAN